MHEPTVSHVDLNRLAEPAQSLCAEVNYVGNAGFVKESGAVNPIALVEETCKTVIRALENNTGDLLVVLPGVAQIRMYVFDHEATFKPQHLHQIVKVGSCSCSDPPSS